MTPRAAYTQREMARDIDPGLFVPIRPEPLGIPERAPEPSVSPETAEREPSAAAPGSAPTFSAAEKRIRHRRNKANQDETPAGRLNPHAAVGHASRQLRSSGHYHAPLTVEEQVRMASTLSSQFFEMARIDDDPARHLRANDVKHWATAWAIVTDKLALLQGRPTQIVALHETARPSLRTLGLKLASATVDASETTGGISA